MILYIMSLKKVVCFALGVALGIVGGALILSVGAPEWSLLPLSAFLFWNFSFPADTGVREIPRK